VMRITRGHSKRAKIKPTGSKISPRQLLLCKIYFMHGGDLLVYGVADIDEQMRVGRMIGRECSTPTPGRLGGEGGEGGEVCECLGEGLDF